MRQSFIEDPVTRYRARKMCPWASVVRRVCGGYLCFESVDDYRIWCNQK